MRLQLRSNGEVVVRSLDGLAGRLRDASELLEDMGEHMVNTSVPETFRQGGRPERWPKSKWQTGERSQMDTTRLAQSVKHEVSGGKILRVGSNLAYARQRQLGGTIKAKNARALAIPLPGMPSSMRRPRRWGDRLFYMESESGNPDTVGILASKDGKGTITPRFVLRRQVVQPARPFIVFTDDDIAYFSRSVARAVGGR